MAFRSLGRRIALTALDTLFMALGNPSATLTHPAEGTHLFKEPQSLSPLLPYKSPFWLKDGHSPVLHFEHTWTPQAFMAQNTQKDHDSKYIKGAAQA